MLLNRSTAQTALPIPVPTCRPLYDRSSATGCDAAHVTPDHTGEQGFSPNCQPTRPEGHVAAVTAERSAMRPLAMVGGGGEGEGGAGGYGGGGGGLGQVTPSAVPVAVTGEPDTQGLGYGPHCEEETKKVSETTLQGHSS